MSVMTFHAQSALNGRVVYLLVFIDIVLRLVAIEAELWRSVRQEFGRITGMGIVTGKTHAPGHWGMLSFFGKHILTVTVGAEVWHREQEQFLIVG